MSDLPLISYLLSRNLQECRLQRQDPVWGEAKAAATRFAINSAVSAIDVVPFAIGEAPSWTADMTKLLAVLKQLRGIDPTPDVRFLIGAGSELLEIPTLGAAPTHAIEGGLQFIADVPRFENGRRIWRHYRKLEPFIPFDPDTENIPGVAGSLVRFVQHVLYRGD